MSAQWDFLSKFYKQREKRLAVLKVIKNVGKLGLPHTFCESLNWYNNFWRSVWWYIPKHMHESLKYGMVMSGDLTFTFLGVMIEGLGSWVKFLCRMMSHQASRRWNQRYASMWNLYTEKGFPSACLKSILFFQFLTCIFSNLSSHHLAPN